jgi:type IV pilus biogenesis protein CpaD/CtpE
MRARSTRPTRRLAALALVLAGGCLQGCSSPTPQWDTRFGDANRANLAAQVIDPAPANGANPAAGIDGRAARAAYEAYQRSYAHPTQPAALVRDR